MECELAKLFFKEQVQELLCKYNSDCMKGKRELLESYLDGCPVESAFASLDVESLYEIDLTNFSWDEDLFLTAKGDLVSLGMLEYSVLYNVFQLCEGVFYDKKLRKL